MTLTLTIEGVDTLDNGQPGRLDLDRHGAIIGRSPHADWSLPDARNHVSSRHCEVAFRDGRYLLVDHSTNGTYLNGSAGRLVSEHAIADGDRFTIGHYAIRASLPDAPPAPASPVPEADGWDHYPAPVQPNAASGGWADPPEPLPARRGPMAAPEPPAHPASAWDLPAPIVRPSAWSSEPSQARAPSADDVWGRLSEQSEIDWSRGDFAAPAPIADIAPGQAVAAPPSGPLPEGWPRFVEASGLPADRLQSPPGRVLGAAGAMLRQMVGGLILMIEARARAKAQLGVQATGLELDGNNPLKFVRSPERALLQLLDEAERGFMPAERAVEDAFQDLQAHQMATLAAMRGALTGTLARFSPTAVRERAGAPGWLARRLPMLHRARQWAIYERDFEGVVRGADDAFMDIFAKEFRQSYDRHIAEMKARRR